MKLNDKAYNILKWVVMIALPAFCTLFATLAGIWDWPMTEEIVTSTNAIATFLGVILGISTMQYNKKNK